MAFLILSSLILAEEEFYQLEEVDLSSMQIEEKNLSNNDDNLSTFGVFYSTIDENTISIVEESSSSSMFVSFDEALKKAKEEHKAILLELVSTNCKFCEKMEHEVLSQEKVQVSIKKNFVLAQVNVDKEPLPLGLSKQMTPMFVFVTENGDVADMRLGYIEEADFLLLLEKESKK